MRTLMFLFLLFGVAIQVSAETFPKPQVSAIVLEPLEEQRYCGPPHRDSAGNIYRRSDVRHAFRQFHPCPVTGGLSSKCPGWEIDHVIPLACGGCDAVSNMQWLPTGLKTAAKVGKDRFERKIYCSPMELVQ